jgi:hypothetical protein
MRRAPESTTGARNPNQPLEQAGVAEESQQVDSDSRAPPTPGTCRSGGAGKHKRPMGGKCAKEEVKAVKQRECAV